MKKNNINQILIAILIIISIFVCKALLGPGFFTSHDGHHQLIRQAVFHQGLVDGQFPVRWAGNALEGSGYPLFVFTYRLPFWIGEIVYLIVGNLSLAIKLTFILSLAVSSVAMYAFLNTITKNKIASFFGSLLYIFAPYRFVDIFVRAALGEAFCFIFIPILMLALYQLATNKKNKTYWTLLLIISVSGLILSHMMTFIIFIPAFVGWFLLCLFLAKKKGQYLLRSIVGGIFSLLLTSYYWIPAFIEKDLTQFESAINSYYNHHFITFKQLLYSPWGFGFSMPGVEDDAMSFQLGIAQWLVLLVSISSIGLYFFKKNKIINKYFSFQKKQIIITLYSLLTISFSIILMLPSGDLFFKHIQKFLSIDIPWKFLSVCVSLVPVLLSFLIASFKNKFFKYLFIFLVMSLAFYGNRNHLSINQRIDYPDQDLFVSHETSNQHNDYAPRDFSHIEDREILRRIQTKQAMFLEGDGLINIDNKKSNQLNFSTDVVSSNAKVLINITKYPGWELIINNKKQEKIEQKWGRIIIPLERGSYKVKLNFIETKLRKTSNLISFTTLLIIICLFLWQQLKLKNQK